MLNQISLTAVVFTWQSQRFRLEVEIREESLNSRTDILKFASF